MVALLSHSTSDSFRLPLAHCGGEGSKRFYTENVRRHFTRVAIKGSAIEQLVGQQLQWPKGWSVNLSHPLMHNVRRREMKGKEEKM